MVDAAGPGAERFGPGQRVVVDPNLYCNACEFCRRGEHNHCAHWQGVGITRPGGFADFVVAPAGAVYAVPDRLDDAAAALVEPVACVVHAINRLPVRAGDSVLLLGVGPMGLLLLQALRHAGAGDIVVADRQPDRLQIARDLGAHAAWPADDDLDDRLARHAPRGFAIVVDASGAVAAIQQGLRHLRPRGRFLQFGVAPADASITLRPFDLFRHDWQLIGSFALSCTFHQAIDWLAAGLIDPAPVVSHVRPLRDFEPMLQQFRAGHALKVHLEP